MPFRKYFNPLITLFNTVSYNIIFKKSYLIKNLLHKKKQLILLLTAHIYKLDIRGDECYS